MYGKSNQINPGNWIHFRNKPKGAGNLFTKNSDHAQLVTAMANDEVMAKDDAVPPTAAPVSEFNDDEDEEQ